MYLVYKFRENLYSWWKAGTSVDLTCQKIVRVKQSVLL